jgi:putative Ca2+/H+ antiporter (TMEM165/GDT1 family)/putative Mn2+ efflux pump MntP
MGDKTQLLAMAFATRIPARTVLAAVAVATLLNHALAVAAGQFLTSVIPVDAIALAAALSFILFGLWTIRGDTLDGEDERPSSYGPFMTVAIAFFLAEIGDKTQLATISLAVKYAAPAAVLLGTTSGMIVADGIGILLGSTLLKRLPESIVRLVSAGVFVGFGLFGVGAVLPAWLPRTATATVVFVLSAGTLVVAHRLFLQRRRVIAHAPAAVVSALPPRLSQLFFAVLLAVGWTMSLGLFEPLVEVDHWAAFALLAGLGWRLIHDVVRPGAPARGVTTAMAVLVLLLTLMTFAEAFTTGDGHPMPFAPGGILCAALVVLFASPLAARRSSKHFVRRVADARLTVASGLLLLAVATEILLDHLT